VIIGIVGLGRMGASLGKALAQAGVPVQGFDLSSEARERARALGIVVHESLADLAASCDAVATSLPTAAAVRSVVFDLGDAMPEGALVIETSTSGPTFAHAASERLARRGVRFVDCPVSGKAPELAILVGGTPGVLGEAEAVLEHAAASIVHLGALGAGYSVKLLQQYMKYARFLVAAEALTFAAHEGLDIEATVEALSAGTGAQPGLASAEEYFLQDAAAVLRRAPVSTISKDVELAREMFSDAGFHSPSFDSLAEFFLAADSDDMHDRPYPEVIDLLPHFRFAQESRHDHR
jgi:3-hydroxyisobutyrate dehydrogenase-like beta-hydroxyacid dehydrogenase